MMKHKNDDDDDDDGVPLDERIKDFHLTAAVEPRPKESKQLHVFVCHIVGHNIHPFAQRQRHVISVVVDQDLHMELLLGTGLRQPGCYRNSAVAPLLCGDQNQIEVWVTTSIMGGKPRGENKRWKEIWKRLRGIRSLEVMLLSNVTETTLTPFF